MTRNSWQCLLLLATLLFAGCRSAPPLDSHFLEVRIESHPQGWGYAHKTVKPDGTITGGHLSGGPDAPRVYETSSRMSEEDMTALRALVAGARVAPAGRTSAPDQKVTGYSSVIVVIDEGIQVSCHALFGKTLEPSVFQSIWELLHRYEVGAW